MIKMVAYRFCDIHRLTDAGAEVPADDEATIRWEVGGKPYRVDVCVEHKDPSWQAMTAAAIPDLERSKSVMKAAAKAPSAPSAATNQHSDPGVCAICGGTYRWLSTHIHSKHNLAPAKNRAGVYRCPLCSETNETTTGLGQHFTAMHDGQRLMHVLAEQHRS